jgi:sugar lactone lactonase YvrE
MPWWERGHWRLAAAVSAIGAAVVAVVVTLVVRGLGTASALVAVLSVVSTLGTLASWGRTRSRPAERMVSRRVELATILRDLAGAHGLSWEQIQEALSERGADALLDGTILPGWEDITAFLAIVAHGNQGIREGLERLVMPVWEAARRQDANAAGNGAATTVVVQVTADAGMQLALSQQTAEAGRAASRLQESVDALQAWRDGLSFTLGKYVSAITALTDERDELAAQLTAQEARARQRESGYAARSALMAEELRDIRARLTVANALQEQLRQRLAETERSLMTAEKLRDDAVAQATRFRQDLARLEHSPMPQPITLPVSRSGDPYRLLGDASQQLGDEIIERAGVILKEQKTALLLHQDTLSRLGRVDKRPQPLRLGHPAVLITCLVAVTALASFFVINSLDHSGTHTQVGAAHSPTASPTSRPRVARSSANNPAPGHSPSASSSTAKTRPTPLPTTRSVYDLTDPGGRGVLSVAFSPDGTTVAAGDRNGNTYLFSLATHKIVAVLADPKDNLVIDDLVLSVAFSPDGTTLAAGAGNGNTYLFSLATHKITATLTDPGGGSAGSVAFSSDGTILAVADWNGNTYLFSLATHKVTATLTVPGDDLLSVAFSPDGTTLAADGYNGNTYLFSLATHKITATLTHSGSKNTDAVAFSPDGTTFAVGDYHGYTYLFSLATHKIIATLTDPGSQGVYAIAYSPHSATIAAGDWNGHTYLFSLATHKIIATLTDPGSQGVHAIAYSPDGTTLSVADDNGSSYLWRATDHTS